MDTSDRRESTPEAVASDSHDTHVVVWDVPPTIDRGAMFRFKVGVKCAQGCRAEEWSAEIRDDAGRTLAKAAFREGPWTGTAALYYADANVIAPDAEGLHAWEAYVPAIAATGPGATAHPAASTRFNVRVVPEAACVLKVIAVDARTQLPVRGARVVVHPYRTSTDEDGVAELRVPKGAYRIFVSDRRYVPFRSDGEVETETTIRAELDADVGLSDAELWA